MNWEQLSNLTIAHQPTTRCPLHPGQFLERRYLKPLKITQQDLARALGVSRRRVNELIQGHRGVSPDTALRLASFFQTDARFWLDLQANWDLYQVSTSHPSAN